MRVRITDVSARDGLQNEKVIISTADKAALVRRVLRAGVDEVEVTSFVSAKWVPQLGDAAELLAAIAPDVRAMGRGGAIGARAGEGRPEISVLVPNERGLDGALASIDAGAIIDKVSVFTAASETFNRRNTNASIAESLERFGPVISRAHQRGLRVRGYVSCVVACPFEGPIAPSKVAEVSARLVELGVDELDWGDTIGVGTPETVTAMIEGVIERLGRVWLEPARGTLHLHDTFGRAGACVAAALKCGIRSFDASVGGLGGCPYAGTPEKPAPGNIAMNTLLGAIDDAEVLAGGAEGRQRLAAGLRGVIDRAALEDAAILAMRLRGGGTAAAGGAKA
jgi:hydroxymethylglutaryl-CoA lyase